jgi:PAS domain S-box-containing protein
MLYNFSMQSPSNLHEHFVQFYEKDSFLIEELSKFLVSSLQAGQGAIVIATPSHRAELERRLRAHGVFSDVSFQPDQYIALDAAETLSQFMVDGWPDAQRFAEVLGNVIRRATRDGGRRVRAFGEMVTLLWAEGLHKAAIRLEELWNDLIEAHSLSLLCAYPMEGFRDGEHGDSFLHICDAHSQVWPAESFLEAAVPDELRRQIALLQQKAAALETEVAKRRQAEQALRQRERELTDFLENAVEGLHKVGADGTVLWANKAELDMLGYEPEEYIGRPIADFHVDRDIICEILDRLQRGESLYACPARLRCKDGSIKHVEIHSNVLFDGGEFVHTRCFTRDVTDRVRLETELQKKVEQLAEADRRKDEFLAMLGHELRNPMAAIVTATELIRLSGDNPAHVARAREIVARQSSLMSRLIDDLLDVSRITRGKIELKTETVLLDAIVERAVESVRPLIDERGHRLTVELPAEPVPLTGDAARLAQVLANLLHNAAKYTDPGGYLALSARQDGTDLLVSVRDDGVGMTPEMCEQVFELFVQAPASLDRARGGLGIGLTLVRTLVALHGGSIQARSDGPGLGCEFIVRLPLPQAVPAESRESAPTYAALV